MGTFELDPDLIETLKTVRRDVREVFEQLRLKGDNGDIPGKDRLERVPALAKNNFRRLTSASFILSTREAWRLVDFLEGSNLGLLSARAREGLRPTELDRRMAAFRSSETWKQAAARLREALNVAQVPGDPAEGADSVDSDGSAPTAPVEGQSGIPPPIGKWRRWRNIAFGALLPVLIIGLAFLLWPRSPFDARYACLALEEASPKQRAAHFSIDAQPIVPRQPFSPNAQERAYPINDDDPGPVRSIWTTSQFSYAEPTTRRGPGGGRADFRLRVGGWGDTYLSLLQVPVPTNHLVQKAVIRLRVLGDTGESRPTTMTLRVVGERWQVGSGADDRLWWRDCPHSSALKNHLPRPGPRYSAYDIDITDLYNLWALGGLSPYGIMLEPEEIGSWGAGRPHYSNFNTFYSTRARDAANRPQLILTY